VRIFLDTNVFLYAAGRPHPEHAACVAVLQRVAAGSLDATSSTEVVQEILHVLSRRGRREQALMLARGLIALFPDLLSVTRGDVSSACILLDQYPRLSARDALHASTMLRNGIDTIVSADADFDSVDGIRRVTPSALTVPAH